MLRRPFVFAALAAAVALAAPAAAHANTIVTFKEVDKGSTFTFLDNPPKSSKGSISTGDMFVLVNPLVNDHGQHAGHLRASCTVTKGTKNPNKGGQAICYGVFSFANGTIDAMVALTNLNAKTTTGGIVGGTGAYAGARGTLKSVKTKTGSNDTITILT